LSLEGLSTHIAVNLNYFNNNINNSASYYVVTAVDANDSESGGFGLRGEPAIAKRAIVKSPGQAEKQLDRARYMLIIVAGWVIISYGRHYSLIAEIWG